MAAGYFYTHLTLKTKLLFAGICPPLPPMNKHGTAAEIILNNAKQQTPAHRSPSMLFPH